MTRRKPLLPLFLVVFVLPLFLSHCGNRDERRIRKNLETLASLLEKTEKESVIQAGMRAKEVAAFFKEDLHVEVGDPVPRLQSKQDLIRTAVHFYQGLDTGKVRLSDVEITLEEDGSRAVSVFTAVAAVTGSPRGSGDVVPRELEVAWEKAERKWKIREVRTIEIFH